MAGMCRVNPATWVMAAVTLLLGMTCARAADTMDLSGTWRFQLDPEDAGIQQEWFNKDLRERIKLPGSLQEQGFGDAPSPDTPWVGSIRHDQWAKPRYVPYRTPDNFKVPFWLQPDRYYMGSAWYQRDVTVPASWGNRRIALELERCHWETSVWVDGQAAGSANSLSAPHRYDLTGHLTPGRHRLTICVDNRVKINVGRNAHSVSDHTQSNWNGIVGALRLISTDRVWIDDVQVYSDPERKRANVNVTIGNMTESAGRGTLTVTAVGTGSNKARHAAGKTVPFKLGREDRTLVTFDYPLSDDVQVWDEFTPALYRLTVAMDAETRERQHADNVSIPFGVRHIATRGTQFILNGRPLFLRGTLECCIFPLTGYPPTNVEAWKRVIRRCKEYGLNHIRFHSHCPPEAAFVAADELGFYFQVEGPFWTTVGQGNPIDRYIYEEWDRILREYGNHPSFLLMAYGNEPSGPGRGAKLLGPWVEHYKKKDPRRLVTCASGWPYIPENQFHVMHRPLRLHGRLNANPLATTFDYTEIVQDNAVPLISHESGQWCVFPNLDEIAKYTGVLKPRNFEIVRDFLEQNGMLHQARDFLMASGKFQALLYKQEIESFLRTPELGGFQLLDLHDFPGQGTALVGVLDPFWDDKPYITAGEHRRYCGPVVPLARMPKRVWTNDETFTADMDVAQFGPKDLPNAVATWKLTDSAGKPVASGQLPKVDLPAGKLSRLGRIQRPLSSITVASQLNLAVAIEATPYANDWDVWVYPPAAGAKPPKDVLVTGQLNEEALAKLDSGGKVLLNPQRSLVGGDTYGSFEPIFWNRMWFPNQQVHTLGILCDPQHPALAAFPTDSHSNWQWWDLNVHAKPIVMDGLPRALFPIVQVIDDWNTCRKLGLLFEAKVGAGKLMMCSIDLTTDMDQRPVARQFRYSILKYMATPAFAPGHELTVGQLTDLSKQPSALQRMGASVRADSEEPGHEAALAIDDNPDSMWHTAWTDGTPGFPHELTLTFKQPATIRGVKLLPRRDNNRNGWIRDVAVYVSDDGKTWGTPVAEADLSNDAGWKTVTFDRPVRARHLRIRALRPQVPAHPWASLAELDLIVEK